jgi:flagellar basal-body rod protein FlgB
LAGRPAGRCRGEHIANANTPGYKAADVPPFEAVFNDTNLTMSATNALHIGADPTVPDIVQSKDAPAWEISHSVIRSALIRNS